MNNIKINEEFTVSKDPNCWLLRQRVMKTRKDGTKAWGTNRFYHATLDQSCKSAIDKAAGETKTLLELRDLLESASKATIEQAHIAFGK